MAGVAPLEDPLASLPPPDWGDCTYGDAITITGTATLFPGTYCNDLVIEAGANVILEPGVYVFGYASVSIAVSATVTGDDVMIYYSEFGGRNANFSISGGADVALSAAESGTYEGIVFYSDRNSRANVTHSFTGGATMDLTGIVYAPNQSLLFAGGADLTGSCVTIISRLLTFTGDTDISVSTNCPDELAPLGTNLRLVQ